MRKLSKNLALSVILIMCCSILALSQDVDLTGTWEGTTFVPDQGEDGMTLVIKKEGDEYTGTATDTFGMLMDTECQDLVFEDGTLSFFFSIGTGMESMTVWVTLEVEGDTMKGYWEVAEGDQGDIELKKNK
jgi:hypothetical protein